MIIIGEGLPEQPLNLSDLLTSAVSRHVASVTLMSLGCARYFLSAPTAMASTSTPRKLSANTTKRNLYFLQHFAAASKLKTTGSRLKLDLVDTNLSGNNLLHTNTIPLRTITLTNKVLRSTFGLKAELGNTVRKFRPIQIMPKYR